MTRTALLLLCLLTACGPSGVEKISVKGSDTEVNLVLQLAETYMNKHELVSIAVTGGGSGAGISALINGKTDIANSSRAMSSEELKMARENGHTPTPVIFALDAIALITHPSLGIDSLSIEQIGDIFRGDITNWKAVGGPDRSISLYGRQSNSGTFIYFRNEVVADDYSSNMMQMNGTAQIIESIKSDKSAIGYVGVGYLIGKSGKPTTDVWALQIYNDVFTACSPYELERVRYGDYILTRPLIQYVDGEPEGELKKFLQFELSDSGQQIIGTNGYIPIGQKERNFNSKYGL